MSFTDGTLFGGRLHYRQTTCGHRSGIEPVLLAATIPARPGDNVIEAGTGAGAGLLCLNARVAGLKGIGIERDPDLASLAADNFRANAAHGLMAIAADVNHLPLTCRFDHGFANPPWRSVLDTASPDLARQRAHRASSGLLSAWTTALAAMLRPRGSLTFILPASSLDECLFAMKHADCGAYHIMPLWPRVGRPAKLVIIQSRKDARGSVNLRSGLILHGSNGYTPETELILRDGAGLAI
ncbi:MAG: SAM-dependent methyltransferase [Acidiphilium sp.]|nr:SAM-dependent methyltransferase [Acidiphilium sp.]MDD4935336.1 SAM-dependent methyltransferase [Acidiphilium sp.]